MRRRDFLIQIGAAVAWPLAAQAQEAGRTYRVGAVSVNPRNAPIIVAIFDELQRLGFIEGQNLTIDWRTYGPRADLVLEFEALGKTKADVIYAGGPASIRAAQKATTTIPILAFADDLVGSGLVNSLPRPGGNTTGVSVFAAELDGKRQEIMVEAVPGLRRMAVLADSNNTTSPQLESLRDAARARSVELSIRWIAKPDEVGAAVEAAKASGAEALDVLGSGILWGNRRIILQRAAELRLPAMYQWPDTTSGACDGGGQPVVVTGGLIQTTSCPPNPISKKIPPLC